MTGDLLLPSIGVAIVRPLFAFLPLPLAGTKPLPPLLQASLALALAVFVLPQVALDKSQLEPLAMVLLVLGEAAIGLAIGLALSLAVASARIAGELIGGAMGIGFAALIDPEHGQSVPTVGQFLSLTAVALFMALDGPVVLVGIVHDSYRAMPPGQGLDLDLAHRVALSGGSMFAGALRLAMPVLVATLIVQLALGVVARVAPAINLLAVGLPATLIVGLLVLTLGFAAIGAQLGSAWKAAFALAAQLANVAP